MTVRPPLRNFKVPLELLEWATGDVIAEGCNGWFPPRAQARDLSGPDGTGAKRVQPVIWQRTAERCYEASIIAADRPGGSRPCSSPPLIVALAATFGLASLVHAEIPIGMAGPLTGPNAWFAEQTERGVALAVADLNAAGGVLGQQVEVVTADDYCDGEQAMAAADKLVAVGVVFVAGHPCSGAAIPASEVHAAAGTLMISSAATNPMLTARGLDNVFRVVGRDDQQGTIAGDYLADRWGDKSIAIVHDGEAYGRGLAEETRRQLNARGVQETLFTEIMPHNADSSPWSPSCPRSARTWCTTAAMRRKPG